MLSYFDLHCDTLLQRYLFPGEARHLDRDGTWERRRQMYAVYSKHKLTPQQMYDQFFRVADTLPEGGLLALEGGELLGDDISRLDEILKYDLKYFTLVWADTCPIGGGWNTDVGLTDFGREVVRRLDNGGVLCDLSHSSETLFWDTLSMTENVIATHSNSRSVCDHKRNLTDDMFCALRDAGTLVGVSMCTYHLNASGKAGISDVIKHIEHYMSLGGEHTVALGCDFDGIDETPDGISCPEELYNLADALLKENYPDALVRAIFYDNANTFFEKRMENK